MVLVMMTLTIGSEIPKFKGISTDGKEITNETIKGENCPFGVYRFISYFFPIR
jgi:peroxiredoxin